MNHLEPEIGRLLELMPASGRMYTKIISKPQQPQVITTRFPAPWQRENRPININFDLWRHLPRPQRDLLLLRAVCALTNIKWFELDIYQVLAGGAFMGFAVELVEGDPVGMLVAGSLSALAATQIWRENRSPRQELIADEAALHIAERRGYSEAEAARNLLEAVEALPELEGRSGLDFIELMRVQNLRRIAGLSRVTIPEKMRQR